MSSWVECPDIQLDLEVPIERRYDHVPDAVLAGGRRLLDAVMAELPSKMMWIADAVRLRTRGRFHAEMRALARRVDVDWRQIMIANLSYDLVLARIGCSTVVLPTARGPVLARNMDWWPEEILAQSSCLVRSNRKQQQVFANAGWPGTVGVVSGLSGRGFGVVLNAVSSGERPSITGYPVLLHIRRVLEEAAGFDAAVEWLSTEKLVSSCLLTVVGSLNHERVVVERTPSRSAQRWPQGDEPLVTTNDYRILQDVRSPGYGELYASACTRYDGLTCLLANHRPDQDISDESLLFCLTEPEVIQSITAQHVIMRPSENCIRLFVPGRLVG